MDFGLVLGALVEPYDFVRFITISLASVWTLLGWRRLVRFLSRWEQRLAPLGIDRPWLRKQAMRMILRVTVLDPVNLALMLLLIGLWTIRYWAGWPPA